MGRKKSLLSIIKDKLQGGSKTNGDQPESKKEEEEEDEEERSLMEVELEQELAVAFDTYSKVSHQS